MRTAAPTPRYDDEISLRELYLILVRGLPTIVVVTLVAIAVALGYGLLRPDTFEAEATVVSSPTTVEVRGAGDLGFVPRSAIDFGAYETIAMSRGTFEAAIAILEQRGPTAPASFRALRGAATVERLAGPSGSSPSTPLTIVHRVVWADPALAAAYTDAWAQATVEQVRSTLLADLEPTRLQVMRTIETREAELTAADAELAAFDAKDIEGVRLELRNAASNVLTLQQLIDQVDRTIGGAAARIEVLRDSVNFSVNGALDGSGGTLDAATLQLLEGTKRLDPDLAARLGLLATRTGTSGPVVAEAVALLARTDLQAAATALASATGERAALEDAMAATRAQIERLRATVAELEAERREVTRRHEQARFAFETVQAIEPAIAFVAELTPSNTRVLNAAQEPLSPTGTSSTLFAVLAAVVAALAATLFVFLREAVRDPAATAQRRGAASR